MSSIVSPLMSEYHADRLRKHAARKRVNAIALVLAFSKLLLMQLKKNEGTRT